MRTLLRWCGLSSRGVVAVEFAVTMPVMLFFLGAVTDFGIAYYEQSCLSAVVGAGAAYAMITDASSGSVTQAHIESAMSGAAAQTMPNATVSVSAGDPTQCYCITGTSPSSTLASQTCGSTCASGGTAGKYVQLTASTNYTAMLPTYSMLTGTTTLSKSIWVPLQ